MNEINVYRMLMPSKEDLIIGGAIVAVLAVLGITFFVLSKRKKSSGYSLKRIDQKAIMTNLETVHVVRDSDGNMKDLVIHREVTE